MPSARDDIPFADTLQLLLPGEAVACMLDAAVARGARVGDAWQQFIEQVNDPAAFLRADRAGVKRHLPLLYANLVAHDVALARNVQPILRTAAMREELRAQRYRGALQAGLQALHGADIPFVLLKGAALGETVYAKPTIRHSHDVDLLVAPEHQPRAAIALTDAGYEEQSRDEHAGQTVVRHTSGLPIEMHSRLFGAAWRVQPDEDMRRRAREVNVLGVTARVLERTDMAAHVLGHVPTNPRRNHYSWIVDTALLARDENGAHAIDWRRIADILIQSDLALSGSVTLGALAARFELPVPDAALRDVSRAARRADRFQCAVTMALLRHGSDNRWLRLWRASGPRSRGRLVSTMLLPPAAYVRCRSGARSWPGVLAAYVQRPVRFAARQARKWQYRARRALRLTPPPVERMERV